jgi:hypothetical protein
MSKQEPIRFQGQYLNSNKYFHICGGTKKKKGEKLLFYPTTTASLSTDGVNDFARSGNKSQLAAFTPDSSNGISIAGTFYPRSASGFDCIAALGKLGTGASLSWDVAVNMNTNKLVVGAARLQGAGTQFSSDAVIFQNTWNTFAVDIDCTLASTTITMWINGVKQVGSYSKQGNSNVFDISGTTSGRLTIGAYGDYLGNYQSSPFFGYINNLCISGGGDNGRWTDNEMKIISKTPNIDFETMGYMNNSLSNRGVVYRFENNGQSLWTLSRNVSNKNGATYTTNVP